MTFLQKRWYVAAWPEEIGREFLSRTILNKPVLFYRTEDGSAVALQDRCPHRFVPLSEGRLIGDVVECGYHGLRFESNGNCILNPHGDRRIPPGAHVASYPVAERHGLVWIWMGPPELADPGLIPGFFDFMAGPHTGFRTTHNYVHARYGADILIDNLMDLSHAEFLHRGSFSAGYAENSTMRSFRDGDTICVERDLLETEMPPFMAPLYDGGNAPVDHWQHYRWVAPGLIRFEFGVVRSGEARDSGARIYATHIATPETTNTTHYFASISRLVTLDDASEDETWRLMQRGPVEHEDSPMLEKQQAAMAGEDFWSLKPLILETDAGAVRVRRMMKQLINEEQESVSGRKPHEPTMAGNHSNYAD